MPLYDHAIHAGNAGDLWKHFLLNEAADWLLQGSSSLIYAESHCGYPHYLLRAPGEWQGGIGRIWPHLPRLKVFPYFEILSELNPSPHPGLDGLLYPGSTRQICELATSRSANLKAEIWDNHPDVAASWQDYLSMHSSISRRLTERLPEIRFYCSDGFSGLLSHINRNASPPHPALLLIDPPYIDSKDAILSEMLLQNAREKGWTVLWWYMTDLMTAPSSMDPLILDFSWADLDGGRWSGAGVALAAPEDSQFSLRDHLRQRGHELIRMLKWY
ncbi:MAG TPA: 23S rRNA (adenine(2030)-N(6))-methyltransferase RlmJ [Methanothrix sp.]|jgi:23S rRNA (adenine2030-N6)-methyltransferase|nr:23S rRNA (adenine(2030)-N(6))-methyltransferase RlmJ [Methanothrix sp.]HQE97926.1 23S rRNA (adenine(2030)-N(6))-methyltransferase RlmJ [Methanothrix sp.]HQJ79306.1 23S rRNA (adenine(2030)-N(6))-methyltransferase RlmJ [Methanothrix sp.]